MRLLRLCGTFTMLVGHIPFQLCSAAQHDMQLALIESLIESLRNNRYNLF